MKSFISNIIAGVIAGGILAFLQANGASILDSVNTALDPKLISVILALILLGICIGWLLRGLFVWRPKQHSKSNDINKHNREVIMQLDEDNKRLLKALLIKDEIYCSVDNWESYGWECNRDFLQQFMDYETVQGRRVRLTPNKTLRQIYDNNSDLFDVIDDQSIEERVVFDPDKRLYSNHFYAKGLNWWWYTDDQSVKDEQERKLEEEMANSQLPITARAKRKY